MSDLLGSIVARGLVAATPLLLGTIGEILSERAGVMNLGVEGMMAVGAVGGFGIAMATGSPWLGLCAAAAIGALLAALHAFVTVTLRAGQVVSGLALTMLGLGLSSMLGKELVGRPLSSPLPKLHLPVLADLPIIGEILFKQDAMVYLTLGLAGLLWLMLYRTRWGIAVRTVGENPHAAATMGIDVLAVRWSCILVGGACAGLGGGYLSIAYSPTWIEGMVAGRGWIVIALTIFAFWNPLRAVLGAWLFGGIFVAQYSLQSWNIPINLLLMLPYLATLVALVLSSTSARRRLICAPAALGEPFHPGERG